MTTTDNETTGMRTMTVQWHPDAVASAIEHAKTTRNAQPDNVDWDMRIVRGLPLTWQDVAVFVDLAAALEAERVDFASNSAALGYVTDQLSELLDDSFGQRPENIAAAVDGVQHAVKVLAWLHAEALHHLNEAQAEISDLRDRATRVRENEHIGYVEHLDDLITALGQHADPHARTLKRLIDQDVTALREAYDTVEAELIEWRTGQRAVEASAAQWVGIQSTLDTLLSSVQELAGRLDDAQHERLRGELPTGGEPCPVGVGTGPDGDDFDRCNQPAAPSLDVCAEQADRPVVETSAAPSFPCAGQRAVGTDLDGETVVGVITGFFAWNSKDGTNDRANLQLDNGSQAVVTTASLQPTEPLRFTHDTED